MSGLLLSLWVAFIGADRINLLDRVAFFTATPYLALTPVVVFSEMARRRTPGHELSVPRTAAVYVGLLTLLVGLASASVVVSPAVNVSAARVALLVADVGGTFAVALAASDRPDFGRVLARGAAWGILLFVVFDVFDLASLFHLVPVKVRFGTVAVSLKTYVYNDLVPRLAGPIDDVNRGGLVLASFAYFVWREGARGWTRWALLVLAAGMLAITVSRSAIGAALTIALAAVVTGGFRMRRGQLATACLAACAVGVLCAASPTTVARVITPLNPLTERFSPEEGSAVQHVALLRRGLEEGTESPSRLGVGMGYGSAFTVLQDQFPNNKYASFHSLFVTMFAECGFAALLTVVVLLAVPMLRTVRHTALVAGMAFFSIAQNGTTEPVFWFALALGWIPIATLGRTATH